MPFTKLGLPPALLPKVIVRRVHGQPVQPRFKDLFLPELIERKIQSQEYFLCDVLDVLRTGDQTSDRPQNPFPVSQYDLVERSAIAFLRARNQTEINQHAAP